MKDLVMRLSLCWLLMACMAFTARAEKYALLVGIDEYPAPNALHGCVNDVATMRQLFINKFGFAEQNIALVLNADASRAGIETAFRSHLIQQAAAGDIVVFYYSGHGTLTPDFDGDEDDQYDETLCPVNISGIRQETWVTDDMLRQWLTELRTDRVTVILDACHSGTGTRAAPPLMPKAMDIGFGTHVGRPAKAHFRDAAMHHALIAGSSAAQSSYVAHDQSGGVLTTFLAETLMNTAKDVTFERLMQQLVPQVEAYVSAYYNNATQTPQFEGDSAQPVFFVTASELPPNHAAPAPVEIEATFPAGEPADFNVSVVTNQPIFYENELMTLSIQAERDCYIRVYLINAEMQVQQLFPNKWQPENFLKAGRTLDIPGTAKFHLRMTPPYGIEIVKVIASAKQFADLQQMQWEQKPFLNYGKMPLEAMNSKGVAMEEDAPEAPQMSQAVVMYEIRPR